MFKVVILVVIIHTQQYTCTLGTALDSFDTVVFNLVHVVLHGLKTTT